MLWIFEPSLTGSAAQKGQRFGGASIVLSALDVVEPLVVQLLPHLITCGCLLARYIKLLDSRIAQGWSSTVVVARTVFRAL